MDIKKVADKIAEALFRIIEREKRVNKADFREEIEKELHVAMTVDLMQFNTATILPEPTVDYVIIDGDSWKI